MYESNKKLTEQELKGLYPGVELLEGYNEALIGVVTAPGDQCVPVYDTFKVIDIISRREFKNKEEVGTYFNDLVSKAKDKDGFGPLFLQTVRIKKDSKAGESVADELFAEDKDDNSDDIGNMPSWMEELAGAPDSGVYDMGHSYKDEDSDSDSDADWHEEEDYDSDSDSGSDYEVVDEDEFGPEGGSTLQVSVHIGTNDPSYCKITSSIDDVKKAISLLFPKIPRLDMVKEMKFYFDNLDDMEDLEDD